MSTNDSRIISRAYEGHPITFQSDGWFNATQAAARFGKTTYEWSRLPATMAYLDALKRKYGNIPYLKTKRGNDGGTWLHPKLAVRFAQWLDVDFAVWCDEQIDAAIRGDQDWKRLRHISTASAMLLCETLKDQREADGKETVGYHYKNEHCLVNSLLNGKFAGIDRDKLIGWELDFIGYFDRRDSALIAKGLSYAERKIKLNLEGVDWRKKYQSRLSAPTNDPSLGRLEA